MENFVNPLIMSILFLSTGIVGNIFACCFSDFDTPSIGASTAIFGIFGAMGGFVLLNWHKLPADQKGYMVCIVAFIIIMNLLFGLGTSISSNKNSSNDILAHVGGLLAGAFLGMVICEMRNVPSQNKVWEKRVKLIGIILFTTYFLLVTLGVFVFRSNSPEPVFK